MNHFAILGGSKMAPQKILTSYALESVNDTLCSKKWVFADMIKES